MLTKNTFLSSLILASTTIVCSANVIITFEAQPDGTGTRVSLSGSIDASELSPFTSEVSEMVGITDDAVIFMEDIFDTPDLDLILVGTQGDVGDRFHISEPNTSSTLTLENSVASATAATYVSGDLGFSLVQDPITPSTRISISSATNSLGSTLQDNYVLDLVLDVDNDISEYSDFVLSWDSNGAAAGGTTINAVVIPEPSTTALCALGFATLLGRRKRN